MLLSFDPEPVCVVYAYLIISRSLSPSELLSPVKQTARVTHGEVHLLLHWTANLSSYSHRNIITQELFIKDDQTVDVFAILLSGG